jgi:tRNA(fMet)-specific endonuclease VapC
VYVLDTNHCTAFIDADPAVLARSHAVGAENLNTSTICRGELIYMAEFSDRPAENLSRVLAFLDRLNVYSVDDDTADAYGRVKSAIFRHFGPKEKAKRRRTTLQQLGFDENDLWIAATALRHDLTVVSTDADFARIQKALPLKVERWHKPPTTSAHP